MTINYSIQAEVIDITSDTPRSKDVFLVDTNVWYWMTYPKATRHRAEYPKYVNDALAVAALIHNCGLSMAELTHLIEKTERDIYCKLVKDIKPKEYRHNETNERPRVVREVQSACAQVTNLSEPLTVTIDNPTVTDALKRLKNEKVDGYDLFILESMKKHEIVQVITDDGDFVTVPGIQVFTANRNVLQAARNQGKLKTR